MDLSQSSHNKTISEHIRPYIYNQHRQYSWRGCSLIAPVVESWFAVQTCTETPLYLICPVNSIGLLAFDLQAYLLLGLESYSELCLCVWNCTTHLVTVDPALQGDGFYLCRPSTGSKPTEKNVVRMGNCGNGVELQRIIDASRNLRSYVLLLKM